MFFLPQLAFFIGSMLVFRGAIMFEKRVTPYSTASNCCELVCLWACPQRNDLTHCRPYMQDISMWIPEEFVDNDLFEMIRDEGGDQVRDVWVGVDVWAVNGWGRLGVFRWPFQACWWHKNTSLVATHGRTAWPWKHKTFSAWTLYLKHADSLLGNHPPTLAKWAPSSYNLQMGLYFMGSCG